MGENRRAEQQDVGSNPGQTNNQGLLKKNGKIMLTVIWDLSNQMIASLGGEVAVGLVPLVLLSFVNLKGT